MLSGGAVFGSYGSEGPIGGGVVCPRAAVASGATGSSRYADSTPAAKKWNTRVIEAKPRKSGMSAEASALLLAVVHEHGAQGRSELELLQVFHHEQRRGSRQSSKGRTRRRGAKDKASRIKLDLPV